MVKIPKCLTPITPLDPIIGHPAWLSDRPDLAMLKSGLAITLHSLVWRDKAGAIWTCPPGFITDGASIPWLLRWLWSKWDDKTIRPAIIHDLRYALHDYFVDWHCFDNRKKADRSFLDGMKLDCPSRSRRYYIGVRLFGRSVYEYKNEERIMLEWFEVLRLDDPVKLKRWIEMVILAG